jgi:23S rRNA (cytosine1962-C5)-methyltransferase
MEWISSELWQKFAGERTDAHRVATGESGYFDRYGDWILWSGGRAPLVDDVRRELTNRFGFSPSGYLGRELVRKAVEQKPAQLLAGEEPGEITVTESGVNYRVEPAGGYSSGLFLDQRLNRQWVRERNSRRMLNLFAYTGSFSVCAALAGAETCSVDAASRALERARANLLANDLDPQSGHRFFIDDVMKVVPRLSKRGERYDLIVLDPPTFGRADGRVFRIEKHLPDLVGQCLELLEPQGWLLVACNYSEWSERDLHMLCRSAVHGAQCTMEKGALPAEIPQGSISCRIRKG